MKEKVVLKSTHPEEYPDLELECRVILNEEITSYVAEIPEERKVFGYKSKSVKARRGQPGEKIVTTLKVTVDGREYILSEEEATVKERETEFGVMPDMVVTNFQSTSDEEYVVKFAKFSSTYEIAEENGETVFIPVYDLRAMAQVDEDVIITTAWGSKAVCLKGGYIVTYNAEENDYNVIEEGAFNSTYSIEGPSVKSKKPQE